MDDKKPKFQIREGSRNLLLLGLVSIVVALMTTGVSLAVYHNSGDIYLDRSRPGFLPDDEEVEDDNDTKSNNGYDPKKKMIKIIVIIVVVMIVILVILFRLIFYNFISSY